MHVQRQGARESFILPHGIKACLYFNAGTVPTQHLLACECEAIYRRRRVGDRQAIAVEDLLLAGRQRQGVNGERDIPHVISG